MKKILLALAFFISMPAHAAEDLNTLYQGYAADSQVALDQPHRSLSELGTWISDMVADALMLEPASASQKIITLKANFTDGGYQSYLAFLEQTGFAGALRSQSVSLSAVANGLPTLVNQGASGGRYAWLFEIPVILTAQTTSSEDPMTKPVTLRIQIGRAAKGAPPHGILIESWQIQPEAPVTTTP
jgi:hypothetical protein